MDKPQAASASRLEKTSILIALTDKGEVVYGGREIGMSGVQPLVRRMLQKEDVPVIIQADGAAPRALGNVGGTQGGDQLAESLVHREHQGVGPGQSGAEQYRGGTPFSPSQRAHQPLSQDALLHSPV